MVQPSLSGFFGAVAAGAAPAAGFAPDPAGDAVVACGFFAAGLTAVALVAVALVSVALLAVALVAVALVAVNKRLGNEGKGIF